MKLLYQTHSPYARKVLVLAHEIGLADQMTVLHQETSPTQYNASVFALNPLGKVPVLITGDGLALFDSNVICEFLDKLHSGQPMFPVSGRHRFVSLRNQALAQGIADAGILVRWENERRPPDLRWPQLAAGHLEKLTSAFDFIEAEVDLDRPVDIGLIALATALSWIEFREILDFSTGRPKLNRWYSTFKQRQSMLLTDYSGATHD